MSGSILNLKQTNEPFHLKKIQVHVSERWPLCSAESPVVILNRLFQSETLDEITGMLALLPDIHSAIAPAVQASDSGRQQLVIHDFNCWSETARGYLDLRIQAYGGK